MSSPLIWRMWGALSRLLCHRSPPQKKTTHPRGLPTLGWGGGCWGGCHVHGETFKIWENSVPPPAMSPSPGGGTGKGCVPGWSQIGGAPWARGAPCPTVWLGADPPTAAWGASAFWGDRSFGGTHTHMPWVQRWVSPPPQGHCLHPRDRHRVPATSIPCWEPWMGWGGFKGGRWT